MVTKKKTTKSKTNSKDSAKRKKAKILYAESKKERAYILPILGVLVFIAAIGIASQGTFFVTDSEWFKDLTSNDPAIERTELVKINNQVIYQDEVDKFWNELPEQARAELTKTEVISQFIERELLLIDAEERGIEVTDGELDTYVINQVTQYGMSPGEFDRILKEQGSSLDEVKEVYREQILLAKLFTAVDPGTLNATTEEVAAYYEANKEQFYREEQVTIRHILIPFTGEDDKEAAQEVVDEVVTLLDEEENENFCELARNYSSDPGSSQNCGEYTFPKGVMVKEFEVAGFDMEIGERRVIESGFGFHIMLKVDEVEAGYLDLDEKVGTALNQPTVLEAISTEITREKAAIFYEEYIEELRSQANIKYLQDIPGITSDTVEEQEEIQEVQEETADAELEEVAQETRAIDVEASSFVFTGYAVGKSHEGTFDEFSGTLTYENNVLVSAEGVFQVDSVNTGIEGLDNHLKQEDFFDAEQYPEIIITSTQIEEETAYADLTFHGITKNIEFPITQEEGAVSADFLLNTTDFNMSHEGTDKEVRITFTFVPENSEAAVTVE